MARYKTRVLRSEGDEIRESHLIKSAQVAFEVMCESAEASPDEYAEAGHGLKRLGAAGFDRYTRELAAYALDVPRLRMLVYGFRWTGGSVVERRMAHAGASIAASRGVHGLSDKQATELVDGAWTARTRAWLGAAAELDSMLEGVAKLHKPSMWKHIRLHFYRRTYGGTAVSFSALIQKTRS